MKIIVINKGRMEIKEYLWYSGRKNTKKREKLLKKLTNEKKSAKISM